MATNDGEPTNSHGRMLDVYLLPLTEWDEVWRLQQRLVYEMGEPPRRRAALILCEHPALITVGRQGSRRHLLGNLDDVCRDEAPLRFTNRGAGLWLQCPGQIAMYPIVPLNETLGEIDRYRSMIYQTLIGALEDFKLAASRDTQNTGVVVGDREIASVGIAIKNWVAYHGARINVLTPLERFRGIQGNPFIARKMTNMFRELRSPIRMEAVRQSLLTNFLRVFGFESYYFCDHRPLLGQRRVQHVAS